MDQSEKNVVILSNATKVFNQNKLNHFENQLPHNFLEKHKRWLASVQSMSLDLKIKNPGSSSQQHYPSLIFCRLDQLDNGKLIKNELQVEDFRSTDFFFINEHESYNSRKLNFEIRWKIHGNAIQSKDFYGYPCKVYEKNTKEIEFGLFLDKEDKSSLSVILFFNENFFNALELSDLDSFEKCYVSNERYLYKICDQFTTITRSKNNCKHLMLRYPRLINICSRKICQDSNNSKRVLNNFSILRSQCGSYVTKNFKNSRYFELSSESHSSFDIFFTDENFKPLRLANGIPTLVKMDFKSVQSPNNRIHINVNSMNEHFVFENKPNCFKTLLAKELDLSRGNYRCAITSITYKNNFKRLSGFNLDFSVQNESDGVEEKFFIPKHMKEEKQMREFFFESVKNIVDFEINEDDHYLLTFKKKASLSMGKHLAILLGAKTNNEIFEFKGDISHVYIFDSKPMTIGFYPPLMLVYSDIVSHTIIGEKFCQLLKICEIGEKRNDYVTYEFDNVEFFDCPNTIMKELRFDIKSHHGEYLEFEKGSVVFINLVFQRFFEG